MVKQDKFTKFYTIYLWTLFIILIVIWAAGVSSMPNKVQAQETSTTNNCKLLEEENQRLRLEIENLKVEKFEATFSTCRNFCRRLQ